MSKRTKCAAKAVTTESQTRKLRHLDNSYDLILRQLFPHYDVMNVLDKVHRANCPTCGRHLIYLRTDADTWVYLCLLDGEVTLATRPTRPVSSTPVSS